MWFRRDRFVERMTLRGFDVPRGGGGWVSMIQLTLPQPPLRKEALGATRVYGLPLRQGGVRMAEQHTCSG